MKVTARNWLSLFPSYLITIRHGDKETDIRLILKTEHGYADLSVINSGTEIPAEKRDMLFERFYRIDSVRNGEDGHYGLGLSIAKAIAVSHGRKNKRPLR